LIYAAIYFAIGLLWLAMGITTRQAEDVLVATGRLPKKTEVIDFGWKKGKVLWLVLFSTSSNMKLLRAQGVSWLWVLVTSSAILWPSLWVIPLVSWIEQ